MKLRARLPSLNQVGAFLLSLILAIIVWVVAEQQKNPFEVKTISRVAVTFRNAPDGLVLLDANQGPPIVDVRIRAPRNVWERLSVSDLKAFIDLSQVQAGRHELPISIDAELPNVEIMEIIPDAAIARLDNRVEKEITVVANVLNTPPFGYIAEPPILSPPTVRVTGAKSLVDTVQQAEVSIRLADARATVETSEFVNLRDRNGAIVSGLDFEPRAITVKIPITQRQGVSEKTVLPRVEGQPAANYRLTGIVAEPATITIIGDPTTLAALPAFIETTPISITGATGDIEERVPLVLPETVAAATNQAVIVRIGIEPIESSLTLTLKPVVQGLGQGLQVSDLSPQTIDVILQGPLPRLQALTDQNVRAILNLSELEQGVHAVTPNLILPEGITAQTILPETVQVTITTAPSTSDLRSPLRAGPPTPAPSPHPTHPTVTPRPKQ